MAIFTEKEKNNVAKNLFNMLSLFSTFLWAVFIGVVSASGTFSILYFVFDQAVITSVWYACVASFIIVAVEAWNLKASVDFEILLWDHELEFEPVIKENE